MTGDTPPNLWKPPPQEKAEQECAAPTPARPNHCPPPCPCHALDSAFTRASQCSTSPAEERMRRRRSIPATAFGLRVGRDI